VMINDNVIGRVSKKKIDDIIRMAKENS
jgi:NADH:ubiquinone oxidoreductase subunit E